jgi:peptide methionine sulfoxide reductase MsrA
MQQMKMAGYSIATELVPLQGFYPAEPYHQFFEARRMQQTLMTY